MNKEAEERSFEMGKWTIHCALFDVIMQLCHVIHFLDGSPFCVCEKKHLAMSFFHSDCESSKEQSNKKSSFFSLDKGERCWNILKMTKIWSMNRPSWMNAILSLQFKLTSSWCLFFVLRLYQAMPHIRDDIKRLQWSIYIFGYYANM